MQGDVVRVLLVDDSEGDALLARELLVDVEHVEYDIEWASSCEAGARAMSLGAFDVCLLDHHLGARTGLELLQEQQEFARMTPVIMLTGSTDRRVDTQALAEGAIDFLPKDDLSSSQLERAIRYALERKRLIAKLEQEARIDAMTGLSNRRHFSEFVEGVVARRYREHRPVCLAYMDLDGLKPVNDRFGHDMGDVVIKRASAALLKRLRKGDHAARLGGDEFAVVLHGIDTAEAAEVVGEKLVEDLTGDIVCAGRSIQVSASVGIALTTGVDDVGEIIRLADAAMYRAKSAGGRRTVVVERHGGHPDMPDLVENGRR